MRLFQNMQEMWPEKRSQKSVARLPPITPKSSCKSLVKECALSTGNCLRVLPRNSVVRVTDRARNGLKCVEGP